MARESAAHQAASAREQATRLTAVRPPTTPHPHPHPMRLDLHSNSVQYSGAEVRTFSPCFNRSLGDPAKSDCFWHATKAPVNSDTGVPIG
jgi:hypothetical protein